MERSSVFALVDWYLFGNVRGLTSARLRLRPQRSEDANATEQGSALGINTKSSATFRTVFDEETVEFQQFLLDDGRCEYVQVSKTPDEVRAAHFTLQT